MPRVLSITEFQKPRFVTKLEVSFRVSKMEFSVLQFEITSQRVEKLLQRENLKAEKN